MKKRIEPGLLWRIFLAFLIATFLFVMIFVFANSVSYLNYQNINKSNNLIERYILEINRSVESFSCSDQILYESSRKLDDVGFKMGLLEKRFGKDDKRVIYQKNLYSMLEIEHLNVVKLLNERCNAELETIIFFYSNHEDLQDSSENMGKILNTYKTKYLDQVMIYSFDLNIDSDFMIKLKGIYGVETAPIVIYGEEHKFYLENIDQLEVFR